MALVYTITQNLVCGADNLQQQNQITAASDIRFNEALGVLTNSDLGLTFAHSKLVACYLNADQDMTLDFNATSGGSPAPAISLVANQPYSWTNLSYLVSLFTADVTHLYVTTTLTTNVNFRFVLSA